MNIDGAAASFRQAFRQTDLVLYAGTNLLCPAATPDDIDEVGMMPVIGARGPKQAPNVAALGAIEDAASKILCALFAGDFAEARFHSCSQANLAVFVTLLRAGDHVICLHGNDGGHPSQNADGMLAHLAVHTHSAPFNADLQCVDDAALAALMLEVRPKLVMLGASTVLRAGTLTRAAAAAAEIDAVICVDVSHVAGLIAGGTFPNPLDAGANLITASSYKTLGCPPAGFIVGRRNKFEAALHSAASPKLLANYDVARLVRFTTALQRSQTHVAAYATAIVANTDALRNALLAAQIPVLLTSDHVFGTHQILLTARSYDEASQNVARLQGSGITTSVCVLPGKWGSWAIRLGTQLVTRRGMGVEEMRRIGKIISQLIHGARDANLHAEVVELTSQFRSVFYCEAAAAT